MGRSMVWVKKYRLWAVLAALVIIGVIAIRAMFWLGSIGFGWVMFWLVLGAGILATYAWVSRNTKSWGKSYLFTVMFWTLVAGTLVAFGALSSAAPGLHASEVKTIMNYNFPKGQAGSVEYRGGGIWKVRILGKGGAIYLYYYENTGKIYYYEAGEMHEVK